MGIFLSSLTGPTATRAMATAEMARPTWGSTTQASRAGTVLHKKAWRWGWDFQPPYARGVRRGF